MKLTITSMLTALVFLLSVVAFGVYTASTQMNFANGEGFSAFDCTITTSTAVVVGDDISSTILAEHSRRAWAVIQQPRNATNTVALSLDEGAAAVRGRGYQLSTSTAEVAELTFGLNTDLPYTGAVTGITTTGSSTVLVTECRYPR